MPLFRRGSPLQQLVDDAYSAWDAQDWPVAAVALERLVDAARAHDASREDLAGWSFDLALTHKFLRDWPAARRHGLLAAELAADGPGEPAWWNLGIAATALHDWPTARRAWAAYGVDIAPGDGPIEGDYGTTPVRIRTADGQEVVWCRRLDPARAVIHSVPLPGSGRRWGETVLHDGVPNGERVTGGQTYPVFDEIELWAPSEVPVSSVELRLSGDDDLVALQDLGSAEGIEVEAWSTVVPLCAACSEGRVDHDRPHDHAPDQPGGSRCRVGVAASEEATEGLLRRWVEEDPPRRGAGTPEVVA
ncbi:MAG TPA: tetratricopeptide repeat protein [Actinomycetes bacterium]